MKYTKEYTTQSKKIFMLYFADVYNVVIPSIVPLLLLNSYRYLHDFDPRDNQVASFNEANKKMKNEKFIFLSESTYLEYK